METLARDGGLSLGMAAGAVTVTVIDSKKVARAKTLALL
jgi:hypothetical protein